MLRFFFFNSLHTVNRFYVQCWVLWIGHWMYFLNDFSKDFQESVSQKFTVLINLKFKMAIRSKKLYSFYSSGNFYSGDFLGAALELMKMPQNMMLQFLWTLKLIGTEMKFMNKKKRKSSKALILDMYKKIFIHLLSII